MRSLWSTLKVGHGAADWSPALALGTATASADAAVAATMATQIVFGDIDPACTCAPTLSGRDRRITDRRPPRAVPTTPGSSLRARAAHRLPGLDHRRAARRRVRGRRDHWRARRARRPGPRDDQRA